MWHLASKLPLFNTFRRERREGTLLVLSSFLQTFCHIPVRFLPKTQFFDEISPVSTSYPKIASWTDIFKVMRTSDLGADALNLFAVNILLLFGHKQESQINVLIETRILQMLLFLIRDILKKFSYPAIYQQLSLTNCSKIGFYYFETLNIPTDAVSLVENAPTVEESSQSAEKPCLKPYSK